MLHLKLFLILKHIGFFLEFKVISSKPWNSITFYNSIVFYLFAYIVSRNS